MKWTVSWPRTVAEDDRVSENVEADTIEDAIIAAQKALNATKPRVGQVYVVTARVEVGQRTTLPLRSV